MAKKLGSTYVEIRAKHDKMKKDLAAAKTETAMASDAMVRAVSRIGVAVAGAFSAYKAAGLIKDAAVTAARFETLGIVMHTVGKNMGYTKGQMDQLSTGLQKAGISMLASRDALTRMAQANLDLSKASKLARVAQDAAVIGNINSSESFQRLVYGIQSAQIEVLRTIGINVNFERSYAAVAKATGRTVNSFSEAEKVAIRMNAVLEAGNAIAGTYEASMQTVGKQIGSLERHFENLKVIAGEVFTPAMSEIVRALTGSVEGLNDELSNTDTIRQWGEELRIAVGWAIELVKLRSVSNTMKQAAELSAQGRLDIVAFSKAGFVERQRMVDEAMGMNALGEPLVKRFKINDQAAKIDSMLSDAFNLSGAATGGGKNITTKTPSVKVSSAGATAIGPGFWEYQASERYDAISRTLDDEIRLTEQAEALKTQIFEANYKDRKDIWLLQAEDRQEVNSRSLDILIEQENEASKVLTDLSQRTAEAMEQNFSDFFFQTMRGEFKSFADFADGILQTLQRALSDYLGQLARSALFGEQGGTGGLIGAGVNLFTSWLNSAHGNVFQAPALAAYSNHVVASPTVFPFAKGIGLMGEAGAEAVMPLTRTRSGNLGVEARTAPVNIVVNNNAQNAQASVRTTGDGMNFEVVVEQVEGAIWNRMQRQSGLANQFDGRYIRRR